MRNTIFYSALLVSSLAKAAVPVDGWYGSIFGGYTYIPPNIYNTSYINLFNVPFFPLLRDGPSYNGGWNGGGRIGFQTMPLRYEVELTYLYVNLSKFYINDILQHEVEGYSSGIFGMANIYYDFPEMVPCIAPFLGLGLGYGYLHSSLTSVGPFFLNAPRIYNNFTLSDGVFAFQATGGFTYNFSENYALNLAYRYIQTSRPEHYNKTNQAHLASLGVIYRFDAVSYK